MAEMTSRVAEEQRILVLDIALRGISGARTNRSESKV